MTYTVSSGTLNPTQLNSCMVLLLPWKLRSWHSTHIKLFKRIQFANKCRCILWRNYIHNGPILMKLYQPVLGVQFFKHSVYSIDRYSVCTVMSQKKVIAFDSTMFRHK